MNPLQRQKVDISQMSEDDQRAFRMYGKLPQKKDYLQKKVSERKYFDSGDYAMSKAGKAPQSSLGTAIPQPENIPHPSVSPPTTAGGLPMNGSGTVSTSPSGAGMSTSPIASFAIAGMASPMKESGLGKDQTFAADAVGTDGGDHAVSGPVPIPSGRSS